MQEDPRLERCLVTVDYEGTATAVYRFDGNDIDGRDTIDENVKEWSNLDIAQVVAMIIGVEETESDFQKIKVVRE